MHRILAMIERDLRRFRRSPTLMIVSMIMPLVQLVVLGYIAVVKRIYTQIKKYLKYIREIK